jgi:hypothetical protein
VKTRLTIIAIMVSMCQFLQAFDQEDTKNQIKEIVAWVQSRNTNHPNYPRIDSEEALEKVILFVKDPMKYSYLPRTMDGYQLWTYIRLYDNFLYEAKKIGGGTYFFQQLSTITETMNDEKVTLVTSLFINCNGAFNCELLCSLYTVLFGRNPALFVKDLEKRKDWKRVIGDLAPGDYEAFRAGLAKLGDSKFEKELKTYWSECEKRWMK